MEITELYTDASGESHFEKLPVIMNEKDHMGFFSEPRTNIKQFHFQNTQPQHVWDFRVPCLQFYIVILDGLMELETSDGAKKQFAKGDVILFNDVSGKGHKVTTFERSVSYLAIDMDV